MLGWYQLRALKHVKVVSAPYPETLGAEPVPHSEKGQEGNRPAGLSLPHK